MRTLRGSALVHDFFVQDGGAERVALEFASLLPGADVYTSFFDTERFRSRLDPSRVHTWPLQRLLGATPHFRALLPLYPVYYSMLDLRDRAFVLSSSVAFTNAVRTAKRALHVSYVYTPMRYAWDLDTYLHGSSYSGASRVAARTVRPVLQHWDRSAARHPDVVVAISTVVQERIRRVWGREAEIIFPPVDTTEIGLGTTDEGFYLVAARLLAYRRVDLAVRACTTLGRPLVVVGDGPERARLESMAGPEVRFLGHVDRGTVVELFRRCRAYLLPGVEDFGIAPVEAMAAGKPAIAYRAGGALDTIDEGRTGLFFDEQTPGSLVEAIERLDDLTLDPDALREHARGFDSSVFRARWRQRLEALGVGHELSTADPAAAAADARLAP